MRGVLKQGAALGVAAFISRFVERKEGEWLKEKDNVGYTILERALLYKAPEAVVLALLAAWPDAVREKDTNNGARCIAITLHLDC